MSCAEHWNLRALAMAAATAGGRAALGYFRRADLTVEWKQDDSPVTVADREAEAACHAVITAARPDDAWLGEETGERGGGSAGGRRWICDPIDGTRNFVRGVPLWATLVACEEDAPSGPRVVAAAVAIPALGELYDAVLGGGARCNGHPLRVSRIATLGEALFCYETPGWFRRNQLSAVFEHLSEATALQRGLGDAYAHMLVASGRAEFIVEPQLSVWDVAATSLVVAEAGGRLTSLDGRVDLRAGNAVVSNGLLHQTVLDIIRSPR
jgi:histidinol-phosphatase